MSDKVLPLLLIPLILGVMYLTVQRVQNPDALQKSSKAESNAASNIYVQYHLWYTKEDPHPISGSQWTSWSKTGWGAKNASSPTTFISPWRREYASRIGLPLVGLYSSNLNMDAVRYMFELAKKAGISGLFASNYSINENPIVPKHIQIAREVGMPMGLEIFIGYQDAPRMPVGYQQVPVQSNGCTIARTFQVKYFVERLKPLKDDPGYLRVDGRPVVWIA